MTIKNVIKMKTFSEDADVDEFSYKIIFNDNKEWFLNTNNTTHRFHQDILQWVEDGNTIQEAD